jgi:hypothetical protein
MVSSRIAVSLVCVLLLPQQDQSHEVMAPSECHLAWFENVRVRNTKHLAMAFGDSRAGSSANAKRTKLLLMMHPELDQHQQLT